MGMMIDFGLVVSSPGLIFGIVAVLLDALRFDEKLESSVTKVAERSLKYAKLGTELKESTCCFSVWRQTGF